MNSTNVINNSATTPIHQNEVPYTMESNGWRRFSFDKMTDAQKNIASQQCEDDAFFERIKAIVIGTAAMGVTALLVAVAIATAHSVAAFFVAIFSAGTFVSGDYFFGWIRFFTAEEAGSIFIKGTVGLTLSSLALGAGLFVLWQKAVQGASYHWKYANYLEEQALDAKLLKN